MHAIIFNFKNKYVYSKACDEVDDIFRLLFFFKFAVKISNRWRNLLICNGLHDVYYMNIIGWVMVDEVDVQMLIHVANF